MNLQEATQKAIALSLTSDTLVGVFLKSNGEYYATNDTREVGLMDECVEEYKNGQVYRYN